MILQGKDIGLSPIKTNSKEGNEKIKDLHYKINEVLYNNNRSYITPAWGKQVEDKLLKLGGELGELECDGKTIAKKEEILGQLRKIVISLRKYMREFKFEDGDKDILQKVVNYSVRNYIVEKEKGELDNGTIISMLSNQMDILDYYLRPYPDKDINIKSFKSMNHELLDMLSTRFAIS